MSPSAETRQPPARMFFLATALVLAGSFLNFLAYNGHSPWRPDIGLAFVWLLGASVAAAGLYRVSHEAVRALLTVLLGVLAVDINTDSLAAMALPLVGAVVLNRHMAAALAIMFAVVTASQLAAPLFPSAQSSTVEEGAPRQGAASGLALLHVILDEHGALGAFPPVPEAAAARAEVEEFYARRGFRLFTGAYSESLHTTHAVPRAFGLNLQRPWADGQPGVVVDDNRYFDRLGAMGLALQVMQTDFVELCRHPAVSWCQTRPVGYTPDLGEGVPTGQRTRYLLSRFASLSAMTAGGIMLWNTAAPRLGLPATNVVTTGNSSSISGMETVNAAIARAETLRPGDALVAHILLPHYPYAFDANCALLPVEDWLSRRSPTTRERKAAGYLAQVRCTTRKLGEMLDAVARSPAAGRVAVIVHGDHGARIGAGGNGWPSSLIDSRAILFAAALPGMAGGTDPMVVPLPLLLDAASASGLTAVDPVLAPDFKPTVMLEDDHWRPIGPAAYPNP